MSEEIKAGEYVRTENGEIGEIESFEVNREFKDLANPYSVKLKNLNYGILYEKLPKHSFNILDLIEVGDYVNGKKVRSVYKLTNQIIFECVGSCVYSDTIEGDNIKSIVTHEQFAEMEYKINE